MVGITTTVSNGSVADILLNEVLFTDFMLVRRGTKRQRAKVPYVYQE